MTLYVQVACPDALQETEPCWVEVPRDGGTVHVDLPAGATSVQIRAEETHPHCCCAPLGQHCAPCHLGSSHTLDWAHLVVEPPRGAASPGSVRVYPPENRAMAEESTLAAGGILIALPVLADRRAPHLDDPWADRHAFLPGRTPQPVPRRPGYLAPAELPTHHLVEPAPQPDPAASLPSGPEPAETDTQEIPVGETIQGPITARVAGLEEGWDR